jgi:hypothetical protein
MARIHRGIVITTSEHTKDWLFDCIKSIGTKYPIVIRVNTLEDNRWELGGIQLGKDTFDEFIHLMDTTVVKDQRLFDKLFEINGNVFLTEGGYHYMGKFVSDTLPTLPTALNKQQAVYWELNWHAGIQKTFFSPDLPVHTSVFEEKRGRRNMVLENDYLIKYKATWSL